MPSPSKVGAKKPRYLIEVERLRERLHGITLKHNDVVINNVAHRQKIKELENEVYDLKDEVIRLSERNVRLEAEVGRLRKIESRSKHDRDGNLQGFLAKGEDSKILLHVLSTLIASTPTLTMLRDGILSTLSSSPPSSTSALPNMSSVPTPLSPHQPFAYWQPKLNPQGTVKASASPVGIDNTLKEEDEPFEDFAQPRPLYKAFDQKIIEPSSSTTSLSSIASSSSSGSLSRDLHHPINLPPTQSAVLARSQSRSSRAARRSSGFLPPPSHSSTQQAAELALASSSTSQSAPRSLAGDFESPAERSAHRPKGREIKDIPDEWETVEIKQEPLDEARFLSAFNEELTDRKIRVGEVELFDEISPEEDDENRKIEIQTGRAIPPSTPMEPVQRPIMNKPFAPATRKDVSSGSVDNSKSTHLTLAQPTQASSSSNTSSSRPKSSSTSASFASTSVLKTNKPPSTITKSSGLPSPASNSPPIANTSSAPTLPSNSTSSFKASVSKPKTSLVGSMKPPNPKTAFTPTSNSILSSSSMPNSSVASSAAPAEGATIRSNGTYSTSQVGSKGGSSMVKMKDVADQLRKGIVGSASGNSPTERSVSKGKSKAEEEDFITEDGMNNVRVEHREEEDQEGEEDRRRRARRRASPATGLPESGQNPTLSRPTMFTPPPEDTPSDTIVTYAPPGSASSSTTSGSAEEIQGRRGRERKNVNYKEPSLTTKMRKPADDTASKSKPRTTLPSSSRASSQEVEQDLLSSMDARNPALVVPRNDLVRRKSSLPKKLPKDNSSIGEQAGSGSHTKNNFFEEEEEEGPDDEEEDDGDYEDIDERERLDLEGRKIEARRDTGRYGSIPVDHVSDVGGDSVDEEEDDYENTVRRLKIITPAPRASTSSSSSTATRRRDSGLTAGSKKGRTRVLSEDEDDVISSHMSADMAPRGSSTRRQSSRRASMAG